MDVEYNDDGFVESFKWEYKYENSTGTIDYKFIPCSMKGLNRPGSTLGANWAKRYISMIIWTSTPFFGKPRTFNTLMYYICYATYRTDDHLSVVSTDRYHLSVEVSETRFSRRRREHPFIL